MTFKTFSCEGFSKPNNHDLLNKYRGYYNVTTMQNYLDKVIQFDFTLLHTTAPLFRVYTDSNVDFLASLEIRISDFFFLSSPNFHTTGKKKKNLFNPSYEFFKMSHTRANLNWMEIDTKIMQT